MYVMLSNNTVGGVFRDLGFSQKLLFASKTLNIQNGHPMQRGFSFMGEAAKNIKSIIILLKGTYTDSNGQNKKDLNEVGILNVDTNDFSNFVSPYDEYVMDFLKKNGFL